MWRFISAFVIGVTFGGYFAWQAQARKLEIAQGRFDNFIEAVRLKGEAAKEFAQSEALRAKGLKERSDREYENDLRRLRDDTQRMRNAHAGGSIVPSVSTNPPSYGVVCFDRIELDQSLQRFDEGISKLIEEGDANAIALSIARDWVKNFNQRGGFLGNGAQ